MGPSIWLARFDACVLNACGGYRGRRAPKRRAIQLANRAGGRHWGKRTGRYTVAAARSTAQRGASGRHLRHRDADAVVHPAGALQPHKPNTYRAANSTPGRHRRSTRIQPLNAAVSSAS